MSYTYILYSERIIGTIPVVVKIWKTSCPGITLRKSLPLSLHTLETCVYRSYAMRSETNAREKAIKKKKNRVYIESLMGDTSNKQTGKVIFKMIPHTIAECFSRPLFYQGY